MRILIDIGHPAHVHLFKLFSKEMQAKGHDIFITCRHKEFEIDLLEHYKLPYKSFGNKYTSITGKIWGLIEFGLKELITALKFKPDVFLSHGSMYAAQVAFFLRKPHISLEDTFNFEQVRLYKPFTKTILVSDYDHPLKSGKVIKYAGYHELAYLHPNRFAPDENILHDLNIKKNEKYVIIRFVSWKATHDKGHKGLSFDNKIKAIKEFSKYAKVFISSESELPDELKHYCIKIKPYRIHDAIAFSTLLFGESSTMAEESAMLGVPSIYINNASTYYTKHLEKQYGLIFNFSESEEEQLNAITKGIELLTTQDLIYLWRQKRNKMLADKIDVTAFLVWFIENYPQSLNILKENPDFQNTFR